MKFFRSFLSELERISDYSYTVLKCCFWLSVLMFCISLISFTAAKNEAYFLQMSIHKSMLEAAPTTFCSGLIAAVFCDLFARK